MLDKQIEKLRNDIDSVVRNIEVNFEELNQRMREKMLVQN